jgi:hypothetical protein
MLMPKNLDHYYLVIQYYFINKIANYARENDTMRVQAGEETLEDLNEVYENEIKGKDIPVPTFTHVREMSLGQKL